MSLRMTPAQVIAAIGAAITAILFFVPIDMLDTQSARIAGLTVFLIVFWATNVVPPHMAVLIFFALAMLFQVIPPDVTFSGFASGAFWLVFGGFVIGAAVKQTGLATRIATSMALRFGGNYPQVIGGLILLGVALSFIMPSAMGRVVLLVPIAVALADRYDFSATAPGRYGLILATIFGTHLTSFGIMPAIVPNMVHLGTVESVWGLTLNYGSWLLTHFPVLTVLKALVIYGAVLVLYRDRLPNAVDSLGEEQAPMAAAEKRLVVVISAVLLLWMTDFVHGIAPAWVALAAAVVLLLPSVNVLSPDTFNKGISHGALFYVAGVIALGTMIAGSDLSRVLADAAVRFLPLSTDTRFINYYVVSLTAMGISIFGTVPTVPAVMVPLADVLAEMSGLPLTSVLTLQVVGYSTVFFPYQAPPLLVGVLLGELPMGKAITLTLTVAVATVVLLLPLNYVWLLVLGAV